MPQAMFTWQMLRTTGYKMGAGCSGRCYSSRWPWCGNAANQLNRPKDVFVDGAGNLYIADENNERIQKWSPGASSGVTVAGGNGGGSGADQFNAPEGVYADEQGNVYVADKYNYRVQNGRPVQQAALLLQVAMVLAQAPTSLTIPVDVYLDAAKNIYVADINTESSDYHRTAMGTWCGQRHYCCRWQRPVWLPAGYLCFRQTARFTQRTMVLAVRL